jgi:hypothetical protein
MSKGYLVMAQGGYIKQAEYLALSIHKTQKEIKNISVITDQPTDCKLFDQVLPLPDTDMAKHADWKIHNRAQFLDLTPYEETVILDADMLFLTDVSHWWSNFSRYELLITNKVLTYRGNWVTHSPYRETFVENQLPNVYSAFTYFKSQGVTKEFFTLIKSMVLNWDEWTAHYAPSSTQLWPSIDLAMSMAVKILGCENHVTSDRHYPTFTHMKSGCQGWKNYAEDWRLHLPVHVRQNQLRLGSYVQSGVLHYVIKDFVNPTIMDIFK